MVNPNLDCGDSLEINRERIASHRMLDANLNRLNEALRTLEDIARFRDLPTLQQTYKHLRHEVHALSKGWDASLLMSARDSIGDVGREVKTETEANRSGGFADIAAAAGARGQQAIRCIEEVCKFAYPATATGWESLRYRLYDWNARTQLSLQRDIAFLQQATLYVLVDCQLPPLLFRERIDQIAKGGVSLIQIRDKQKDALELIEYTNIALETVDPASSRIIVNDRADVATITPCFGLHVGQTDLSVEQSRRILRPESVVGLSTHDVVQVNNAIEKGADYIGCGPTFPSSTKSFDQFSGIPFLESIADRVKQASLPAFAIGGITSENISQVRRAGLNRVAVSSAVWNAPDPYAAAQKLREQLA